MIPLASLWNLVLANSVRASALIACILLLRWLLGGRVPVQCFHLLWLLAALRLLLPVAPSSATSVFNLLSTDASLVAEASWVVRKEPVASPVIAPTPKPNQLRSARSIPGSAAVLPVVWLAGIAVQTVLLGIAGWRMRRALAGATPIADPRLLALVHECAETLRLRRNVHLFETDAVAGPAVVGLWHPRLLLPPGLSARLSEEQLRFVLLHECAHLRRHDLAALWLFTLARIAHWFNPLVWLATRAARNDAEVACDETVLRHCEEEERVPYGETLVQLTNLLAWRRSPLPVAGILEGHGAMRARVANIATYSAPARWRSAVAALLVLGVGFVFAVDENRAPAGDTPPPESAVPVASADDASAKALANKAKPFGPQIEIESKFIETSDTAILRLKSRRPGVAALRAALRDGPGDNILSLKDAAEFQRDIKNARGLDVLSTPKVTTKSGQRAVIEIIREFRYPTGWERDETETRWIPNAYETRNCGVTLEVEPTAEEGGGIRLHLTPQVVELLGWHDPDSGKLFPNLHSKGLGMGSHRWLGKTAVNTLGKHRVRAVFSARKHATTIQLPPGETVLITSLPETEDAQPFKSPAKAKRLIVTISARLIDRAGEPLAPAAEPVLKPQSNTIDLNLVPQVVEFEGTIDYNGRMQTTSTNALGQSVTNVITPNVINQPVLSTGKGATSVSLFDGTPVVAGGLVREDGSKFGGPARGIVRASDNKPGFVRSPHAPEKGLVDVRGFPPGTEIKCPYSGKLFLVP